MLERRRPNIILPAVKAFLLSMLAAVLVAGGYVFYLHRKLAPIVNRPELSLRLRPYSLGHEIAPTRAIKLGYCQFELPETWAGEPVMDDADSLVISLKSGREWLAIYAPMLDEDPGLADLKMAEAQLASTTVAESWFDVQKRAWNTPPISVWDVITHRKRALHESVLLTMKATLAAGASEAELYEEANIEALVVTRPDFTRIVLHDHAHRLTQDIVISSGFVDPTATVAAVLRSYRFLSSQRSPTEWRAEALAAGVPPRESEQSAISERELADLQRVMEDVRARRAKRVLNESEPSSH